MGKREDLKAVIRVAKEQSADFKRIADKGGEGVWDAEAAGAQSALCARYADRYVREVTEDRRS